MKVAIIGRGKVGNALKAGLKDAGAIVQMFQGRSERIRVRSDVDLIVVCVPDDMIHAVSERIRADPKTAAVHVAGARPPTELEVLRARGNPVGVMHPLVSFATKRAVRLQGASFVCAGDRGALRQAKALCRLVGALYVAQPGHGAAYHAAAALVANGTAALTDAASNILGALGFREKDSRKALAGLLRSVADNVEQVGVPGALTGPIKRGDAATVRAHLRALKSLGDKHARAYAAVAPVIIASAGRAGLPSRDQARLRSAVSATNTRPHPRRG